MSNAHVSSGTSLADSIINSLSECHAQIRILAEKCDHVDKLRDENERLQREVEQWKTRCAETEVRSTSQFQQVFMQVAEKQAEIDRYKERLHAAKLKAQKKGLIHQSSSSSPSSAIGHRVVLSEISTNLDQASDNGLDKDHARYRETKCPILPPKRARSASPLGTTTKETDRTQNYTVRPHDSNPRSSKHIRQDWENGHVGLASMFTEDGERLLPNQIKKERDVATKIERQEALTRLGDLLQGPAPERQILETTRSVSAERPNDVRPTKDTYRPASTRFILAKADTRMQSKKPRVAFKDSNEATSHNAEDEEPLRSRPLHRLGLNHFKVNAKANSGVEYAYHEVIRGQERKCFPGCTRKCCVGTFKALAATLPTFNGVSGEHKDGDELLLDFLGPGSEDKIRSLTPTARENLLHEARTKLIANTFGKMHRNNHERGKSPPGFWRTDMPGTQEHIEDRTAAAVAEREEVARRYDEAMREGGRWIFVDE